MNDRLLEDIADLIKQARTEKSHNYTASVLERAANEIIRLRITLQEQRGLTELALFSKACRETP